MMQNRAPYRVKKYHSLNYRRTLIRIRSLFIVFSCCFGLSILYIHNNIQYDQHSAGYSAGVGSTLRALDSFSGQVDKKRSLHRSKVEDEPRGAWSSMHSHDYNSTVDSDSKSNFGFVMKEFACRVLSRHITSSNVLVAAPGAVIAAKEAFEMKIARQVTTSSDLPQIPSVGSAFLQYGISEGHAIHAINCQSKKDWKKRNAGQTLDAWWRSFDVSKNSFDSSRWWWSTEPIEKPNWILLAVFDSDFGSENYMWKQAGVFLKDCTVTYFVIAVHSIKRDDGSYRLGGMDAIRSLLQRKYKLQTMSLSHYYAERNKERDVFERYGPNALFQSTEEVEGFLRWGADAAERYSESSDKLFTSYIFATQGLDLAIPVPQVYLRNPSMAIDVFDKQSMDNLPPLKMCDEANSERLDFVFNKTSLNLNLANNKSVSYSQYELGKQSEEDFSIWMDGISLSQSEAVCLRHKSGLSRCSTRISEKRVSKSNTSSTRNLRPNLLLILLDPISRSHFDRSMKKTTATLAELNFTRFEKYTAIGPNSGPNQAALYSGTKLKKRNELQKTLKNNDEWLWDRLRAAGYITLKGEDSCIENSNMMQSLAPNTTHGSALQGLFCFDAFSRPNCIGPDLASSLLLEYGYKFISTYEKLRKSTYSDLRWASFMHFVDSHEDTMVLSATVDPGLSKFLQKLNAEAHFQNSVIIVTSDHGLHYGPKFGTRQGRKEATEPILYVYIPNSLRHKVDVNVLRSNSHLWTTPFDVHETILELTQTSFNKEGANRQGLLLTEQLPASRKECKSTDLIPAGYCTLRTDRTQEDNSSEFCGAPFKLPSIDSFFLDLAPFSQRPQMKFDADCFDTKGALNEMSKFDLCGDE